VPKINYNDNKQWRQSKIISGRGANDGGAEGPSVARIPRMPRGRCLWGVPRAGKNLGFLEKVFRFLGF